MLGEPDVIEAMLFGPAYLLEDLAVDICIGPPPGSRIAKIVKQAKI